METAATTPLAPYKVFDAGVEEVFSHECLADGAIFVNRAASDMSCVTGHQRSGDRGGVGVMIRDEMARLFVRFGDLIFVVLFLFLFVTVLLALSRFLCLLNVTFGSRLIKPPQLKHRLFSVHDNNPFLDHIMYVSVILVVATATHQCPELQKRLAVHGSLARLCEGKPVQNLESFILIGLRYVPCAPSAFGWSQTTTGESVAVVNIIK